MKDLNLELANASLLVMVNDVDTENGGADVSVEMFFNEGGSVYVDIEELGFAGELLEWIEENGGEFAFELQSEYIEYVIEEVTFGGSRDFEEAASKWISRH